MIKQIESKEQFDATLKEAGSSLVVVDFSAEWCGPCRQIKPQFEALAKTYTDVVFLEVDVDGAHDVAAACKITYMPTFIFFKNGQKIREFSGASYYNLVSTILELK
ncbi:thioredoxin-like [Latimeria chalumnae]|uniref:thioredoxin-like n=1 Tax=Latimeria chalumnae TaxID=7897 RepID=UPI00313F36C2